MTLLVHLRGSSVDGHGVPQKAKPQIQICACAAGSLADDSLCATPSAFNLGCFGPITPSDRPRVFLWGSRPPRHSLGGLPPPSTPAFRGIGAAGGGGVPGDEVPQWPAAPPGRAARRTVLRLGCEFFGRPVPASCGRGGLKSSALFALPAAPAKLSGVVMG